MNRCIHKEFRTSNLLKCTREETHKFPIYDITSICVPSNMISYPIAVFITLIIHCLKKAANRQLNVLFNFLYFLNQSIGRVMKCMRFLSTYKAKCIHFTKLHEPGYQNELNACNPRFADVYVFRSMPIRSLFLQSIRYSERRSQIQILNKPDPSPRYSYINKGSLNIRATSK